jgi:hypothetical protein
MIQGVDWKDFGQFMEKNGREHEQLAGEVRAQNVRFDTLEKQIAENYNAIQDNARSIKESTNGTTKKWVGFGGSGLAVWTFAQNYIQEILPGVGG